jgi:catechol 2,3-dioxygenase-like lactoylglutathione lyase family enzyme
MNMSFSTATCIYLNVNDMKESIDFYKELLQVDVEVQFEDRWAQFKITEDFHLGLLNPAYDKAFVEKGVDLDHHFNEAAIGNITERIESGNSVVLNLRADNLADEYERIQEFYPSDIGEIMYINFMTPYKYFIIQDPDGNLIEVADT